jgi:hypothetical protein
MKIVNEYVELINENISEIRKKIEIGRNKNKE